MIDIIERGEAKGSKFNPEYLYNPKGATLEEKMKPFNSKVMQLKEFVENVKKGVDQDITSPRVTWWLRP
jgi:hypothetical protein